MLLELLLLVFKHWFRFTLRCSHQRQPGKWGANKHNLVLWLKEEEEENGRNNRLELLGKWGTTITISYYIRSRETWPQVILVMDTVRRRTQTKGTKRHICTNYCSSSPPSRWITLSTPFRYQQFLSPNTPNTIYPPLHPLARIRRLT